MDPLRISPLPCLISTWCYKYLDSFSINNRMIQDPTGAYCGLHAVYYLESIFCCRKSPKQVLDTYNPQNLKANDLLALHHFVGDAAC